LFGHEKGSFTGAVAEKKGSEAVAELQKADLNPGSTRPEALVRPASMAA
jgi:hypothetical protein